MQSNILIDRKHRRSTKEFAYLRLIVGFFVVIGHWRDRGYEAWWRFNAHLCNQIHCTDFVIRHLEETKIIKVEESFS
jgi:hypothetical protein